MAIAASSSIARLEIRNLSKTFGGVRALRDVSCIVLPGEVHGLLGQNGSGKSTLIKILSGYHAPDPGGQLFVDGSDVRLPLKPGQFRELGISFVHQDLGLVESLTILDNMRVGRYPAQEVGRISWREERRRVRHALERLDLPLSPDTRIRELRDVERALVAIVRAVADIEEGQRGGLLVLDEPTVYLPRDSVDLLFRTIKQIATSGKSILFVSHQLGEVMAVTDRATVLRDGRAVGTVRTVDITEDQLIQMILGREFNDLYPESQDVIGEVPLLEVEDLEGGVVLGVSFQVRAGETVGLTGLVGMGFEDVPYLIYGAQPAHKGRLRIGQQTVQVEDMSPVRSIRSGMVLVPANRLRDGIVTGLPVEDNVGLPILGHLFERGLLRLRAVRRAVKRCLETFDVRPADPERRAGTLSGGNQQKAVLGKWLQTGPKVLLLHEPTQGVDVGARKQIFELIRNATESGAGAVIASSEHEDLAHLCDRVLVFRDGAVVSTLSGANLTADQILDESYRAGAVRAGSRAVSGNGNNTTDKSGGIPQ